MKSLNHEHQPGYWPHLTWQRNDLPVLEQEPNQSIPQFGDGIKTDAPRVGIMEQAPQFDTGSNDEKSEETNMFESESEANTPIDNETTD